MSPRTRNGGFTLVEAMIASLVVLIVLAMLGVAARFFFRQSHVIERRRLALIVAGSVMRESLDGPGLPASGDSSWVQSAADRECSVSRRIRDHTEDSRTVTVTVSCGQGGSVSLTGKTWAEGSQ